MKDKYQLIELTKENYRKEFKGDGILLFREGKLYYHEESNIGAYKMKLGEIGCWISSTPSTPTDSVQMIVQKCDTIQDKMSAYPLETIKAWVAEWVNEGHIKSEEVNEELIQVHFERINAMSYLKFLSKPPDYKSSNGFFWGDPFSVIPFIEKYKTPETK